MTVPARCRDNHNPPEGEFLTEATEYPGVAFEPVAEGQTTFGGEPREGDSMVDEEVKVEEQKAEGAETPESTGAEDAKAEAKEADPQPAAHNFDKGLSRVQRDVKANRREMAELRELITTTLANKAESAPTEAVESAVEDFLAGKDADDVASVADIRALVRQLGSQAKGGLDEAAIVKAVQAATEPLLKAKADADERTYWAEFYRDHPELDKDTVQQLWEEAADKGEQRGRSDADHRLATDIYFDELVKSKERSLKRQGKTLSTKSPSSSEGTQIAKKGASTQKASADKPSMDDIYRSADADGRL